MKRVLAVLDEIASTSSRKEKEKILADNESFELKRVLYMAYNPLTMFYIKKIPEYEVASDPTYVAYTLTMALDELYDLVLREVTGHKAIQHLKDVLEAVSPDDAVVIERVVLKDLRCGISDSTINKVWKGYIPEVPYMRCSLLKDMKNVDWEKGMISQTKADGSFTYINNEENNVGYITRNGKSYDASTKHFELLNRLVSKVVPVGWQMHGEMLVKADGKILPRQVGNGMLNSVLKGGELEDGHQIVLQVWDIIPLESFKPKGSYKVPYRTRLKMLTDVIGVTNLIEVVSSKYVYSMQEALEDYKLKLSLGLEGTILKDPESIWEDKTSKRMWKFKLEVTVDLMINDYTVGKGKHADTFGSMQCFTSDGLLEVNVSGISDELRLHIHNNREVYRYKIMAVTSNSLMEPSKEGGKYSLFLPRCDEIREDKTEADALQQVIDQFESVIKL